MYRRSIHWAVYKNMSMYLGEFGGLTHVKDKVLLITGERVLWQAVANRFINTDIREIRIFSRDEKSKMICAELCE